MRAVFALVGFVAGLALLYAGWKGAVPERLVGVGKIAGWGLLLIGGALCIGVWGAEFGLIFAFCFVACAAWVFVGVEADIWQPKARRRRAVWPRITVRDSARQGLLFFFAVLIAGVASMLVSVLGTQWLPLQAVDRMALVVVIVPIIWGVAMFWVLYDPGKARVVVTGVCLCAGLALFAG